MLLAGCGGVPSEPWKENLGAVPPDLGALFKAAGPPNLTAYTTYLITVDRKSDMINTWVASTANASVLATREEIGTLCESKADVLFPYGGLSNALAEVARQKSVASQRNDGPMPKPSSRWGNGDTGLDPADIPNLVDFDDGIVRWSDGLELRQNPRDPSDILVNRGSVKDALDRLRRGGMGADVVEIP